MRFIIFLLGIFVPLLSPAQSRIPDLTIGSDLRGAPELVLCSQNLDNYGSLGSVKRRNRFTSPELLRDKEIALARRFAGADCDVIAVQEVLGSGDIEAVQALEKLAGVLHRYTNRIFKAYVGRSNDKLGHTGFLIAADRAVVLNTLSYARVELPKLVDGEKPRLFSRGPFEVQLRVKPIGEGSEKLVNLVTFHFKSKHSASNDPAQLEWETSRMQMAEALRRIVEERHKSALESGESLLVLLGDRNSNFDSASAKILEGVVKLNNFKGDGVCRVSKRGVPLCQAGMAKPQVLFSVLLQDPQTKIQSGTFRYGKIYSWLDEILMPTESLPVAWQKYNSMADYDCGVVRSFPESSDHALVYVKLNW